MTPASVWAYAVAILWMTSGGTVSMLAEVSMIARFAFTFHWFITISVFPVTARKW